MAIYSILRRLSDGLTADPQESAFSSSVEEQTARLQNNVVGAGWAYLEVEKPVYDAVVAALTAHKVAFLNGETLTESAQAPELSLTEGDGEVTIDLSVGDITFNGTAEWQCTSPDGVTNPAQGTIIDGVDSWTIETGQEGIYSVRVKVAEFGFAQLSFEGV